MCCGSWQGKHKRQERQVMASAVTSSEPAMARCFLVLSVSVLFGAALFERFEYSARDYGNSGDKKAGVLQRHQPCGDGGDGHGDEHDVEPPTKFVHGFDDMQVVIA